MTSVSVIIPTYQSGRFISQAIDSVLTQTFKDFEIIVVDDGSTDNTREVINHYSSEGRIRYYYQSNHGPAAARNLGIRMSSGENIAFLDADDLWLPTKLEIQTKLLDENPAIDLVFCDSYVFNETGVQQKTLFDLSSPASGRVFEKLFYLNFIPLLTVMVRSRVFDVIGFFDETVIGPEDYDLWLRISQTYMVDFIQEPLAKYRISSGQISQQQIRMLENEIKVKEKALSYSPLLLTLPKSVLDKGYFNLLIRIAKLLLQNNQKSESRIYLDNYIKRRGITIRFLAARGLFVLPYTIQRAVLYVWDSIRIPHTH
jgi:glycosyltransferase involved in cell wall biosynthesis